MNNDYNQYNSLAELLKVLAHPVRICIVKGLLDKGECNVTHMQSCLNAPQSTISQHLAKLKAAGIIEARRNGLEVYYKVCNENVVEIIKIMINNENK